MKNMNWESEEGINACCEHLGDMYTSASGDNNVEYSLDLYVVE